MTATPEILLVDDNPADVGLIREVLATSDRHSHISSVSDGEQALAFLHRKHPYADAVRPDLVVLDLNLPRKDGRAVLTEVKADPNLRNIPVVVFTTSRANTDIACSYELGASCYISKPGNWGDFFLAVRSIEEFWFGLGSLLQRRNDER
jgi:two-component system, chemotaxis family, response regulator Rcp1